MYIGMNKVVYINDMYLYEFCMNEYDEFCCILFTCSRILFMNKNVNCIVINFGVAVHTSFFK